MDGSARQYGEGRRSEGQEGAFDHRFWSMLSHASSLLAIWIPIGHLLGPFLVWLYVKDKSEAATAHAREALEFQLSMTIFLAISVPLLFLGVGFFLLVGVVILQIYAGIHASLAAWHRKPFRYPMRFAIL